MIHHICVEKHITIVDGTPIPYGSLALLESVEAVLPEMLEVIVPTLVTGDIIVCGEDKEARHVIGRKIEDRIKREVVYE